MKPTAGLPDYLTDSLSVPSTRAYAMKPKKDLVPFVEYISFSTLNSGLRDETEKQVCPDAEAILFQYPQLGPTR